MDAIAQPVPAAPAAPAPAAAPFAAEAGFADLLARLGEQAAFTPGARSGAPPMPPAAAPPQPATGQALAAPQAPMPGAAQPGAARTPIRSGLGDALPPLPAPAPMDLAQARVSGALVPDCAGAVATAAPPACTPAADLPAEPEPAAEPNPAPEAAAPVAPGLPPAPLPVQAAPQADATPVAHAAAPAQPPARSPSPAPAAPPGQAAGTPARKAEAATERPVPMGSHATAGERAAARTQDAPAEAPRPDASVTTAAALPPGHAEDAPPPGIAAIAIAAHRPARDTPAGAPPDAPSYAAMPAEAARGAAEARQDAPPPAAPPRAPPPAVPARQILPVVVAAAAGGGTARISVTLDPAELGRVEISVERSADASQVTILAERPETLALLLRDQRELDRALDQAGLAAQGRSVSLGLAQDGAAGQRGEDGRRGAARVARGVLNGLADGAAAMEAPARRASLSLLDLAV